MTLLSHPSPKLSTSLLNLLSYCKKSLVIETRWEIAYDTPLSSQPKIVDFPA